MIIPITYKADGGDSSKKGKIRAEDLSALNAFSLPKSTGILNLLNKCEAYSLTPSSPDAFFYLHNGYVVICGRFHYVEEATQCSITLPVSGTETGYFGIKVDLSATEGDECKFFQKTGALVQNDLNENPTSGIYEFPLFRYTATPSTVTALEKIAEIIYKTDEQVPELSKSATYTSDREGNIDESYTIDEKINDLKARVSAVGFKTGGSVTPGAHVTITSQSITRQGNYVIGIIEGKLTGGAVSTLFTLPANFRPSTNVTGRYGFVLNPSTPYNSDQWCPLVTFSTNGTVTASPMIPSPGGLSGGAVFSLVFGFLAPALPVE